MMKTIFISLSALTLALMSVCCSDDAPEAKSEAIGSVSNASVTSDGYSLWDGGVKTPAIDEVNKKITINSSEELAGLAAIVNKGNNLAGYTVILASDLDLSDNEWTPIGKGRRNCTVYSGIPFAGIFDGNGKCIRGLNVMNVESKDGAGLFAAVSGTVKNLVFDKVDISETTGAQTGVVAGILLNGGKIENIRILSGDVEGTTGVGSVVGRVLADGSVRHCVNEATVKGNACEVGGIVGAAYYTASGKKMQIENCINRGSVTSKSEGAGGITGYSAAFVSGCSNYGCVKGEGKSVGGIVGSQRSAGSISDCHNFADVTCGSDDNGAAVGAGGIAGQVTYAGSNGAYPERNVIEIENCTNSGNVMAFGENSQCVGGVVGVWDMMGSVTGCTNTALALSGTRYVGGIIGYAQWPVTGMLVPAGADEELDLTNNTSATTLQQMTGSDKTLLLNTSDEDRTSLTNNSPEE